MPKAKIILVPIEPHHLRGYENQIVARPSGLVRIKKVYAGQNMDYYFLGKEKEIVYGHLNLGFYAVVAWACRDEEQFHFPVLQSRIEYMADRFLPKNSHGMYVVDVPGKYFGPLIHVYLNEYEEASDQPIF